LGLRASTLIGGGIIFVIGFLLFMGGLKDLDSPYGAVRDSGWSVMIFGGILMIFAIFALIYDISKQK